MSLFGAQTLGIVYATTSDVALSASTDKSKPKEVKEPLNILDNNFLLPKSMTSGVVHKQNGTTADPYSVLSARETTSKGDSTTITSYALPEVTDNINLESLSGFSKLTNGYSKEEKFPKTSTESNNSMSIFIKPSVVLTKNYLYKYGINGFGMIDTTQKTNRDRIFKLDNIKYLNIYNLITSPLEDLSARSTISAKVKNNEDVLEKVDIGPRLNVALEFEKNTTFNNISVGIGNEERGYIGGNIDNGYFLNSNLEIKSGDKKITLENKLNIGNASSLKLQTTGDIEFNANMNPNLVIPKIKNYNGDEYDGYSKVKSNEGNETKTISQNSSFEFIAKKLINKGNIYASGAGFRGGKILNATTGEVSENYIISVTKTANVYNAINGDSSDAKEINSNDLIEILNGKKSHKGMIELYDYATLKINGNFENTKSGIVSLIDGGRLNIYGDFKNSGWIVSGSINQNVFGYINVKGSATLENTTKLALISNPNNPILGNKGLIILRAEGGIQYGSKASVPVAPSEAPSLSMESTYEFAQKARSIALAAKELINKLEEADAKEPNKYTLRASPSDSVKRFGDIRFNIKDASMFMMTKLLNANKISTNNLKTEEISTLKSSTKLIDKIRLQLNELGGQKSYFDLLELKRKLNMKESFYTENKEGIQKLVNEIKEVVTYLKTKTTTLSASNKYKNKNKEWITNQKIEIWDDELDDYSEEVKATKVKKGANKYYINLGSKVSSSEEFETLEQMKKMIEPLEATINYLLEHSKTINTNIAPNDTLIPSSNIYFFSGLLDTRLKEVKQYVDSNLILRTQLSGDKKTLYAFITPTKEGEKKSVEELIDELSISFQKQRHDYSKLPKLIKAKLEFLKVQQQRNFSIVKAKEYKEIINSLNSEDQTQEKKEKLSLLEGIAKNFEKFKNRNPDKLKADYEINLTTNKTSLPSGYESEVATFANLIAKGDEYLKEMRNAFRDKIVFLQAKPLDYSNFENAGFNDNELSEFKKSYQTRLGEIQNNINKSIENKINEINRIIASRAKKDSKLDSDFNTFHGQFIENLSSAALKAKNKESTSDKYDDLIFNWSKHSANYEQWVNKGWIIQTGTPTSSGGSGVKRLFTYKYFKEQNLLGKIESLFASLSTENPSLTRNLLERVRKIDLEVNGDKSKGILGKKEEHEIWSYQLREAINNELIKQLKTALKELDDLDIRAGNFTFAVLSKMKTIKNKMNILNAVKNLGDVYQVGIISNLMNSKITEQIVKQINSNTESLGVQAREATGFKALNLATSSLVQDRLSMLSSPIDITPLDSNFAPTNSAESVSSLLKRISGNKFALTGQYEMDNYIDSPKDGINIKQSGIWAKILGAYAFNKEKTSIHGISIGGDTIINDNIITGAYLSYAFGSGKGENDKKTTSNNIKLGIYSRFILKNNEIDFFASQNIGFVNQDRNMKILTENNRQKGKFNQYSTNLGLIYGYNLKILQDYNFYIKPQMGIDYNYFVQSEYKEKGLNFVQLKAPNSTLTISAGSDFKMYFNKGGYFYIYTGLDIVPYTSSKQAAFKIGGVDIIKDLPKANMLYFTTLLGGSLQITKSIQTFSSIGLKFGNNEKYFNWTLGGKYSF